MKRDEMIRDHFVTLSLQYTAAGDSNVENYQFCSQFCHVITLLLEIIA